MWVFFKAEGGAGGGGGVRGADSVIKEVTVKEQ